MPCSRTRLHVTVIDVVATAYVAAYAYVVDGVQRTTGLVEDMIKEISSLDAHVYFIKQNEVKLLERCVMKSR